MHFSIHGLLILIAVLAGLGAILWLILAALMAWAMLRPPRMSAGKAIYHLRRLSPGDLGLLFEELSFAVRDPHTNAKLNLAAWWIPSASPSDGCVVLLHGYADAKVGSIAWAPLFHELNFNVLAVDLRAHGDSDGRFSTGGYFERDDIDQALNQTRSLFPDQTRRLVLFGASLGAAVACGVAAAREDLSAIILDSPFADYEHAIAAHAHAVGLPGGLLLRAAIACAQWISGAKFNQIRPIDLLQKIRCPVLTILGSQDPLLNPGEIQSLRQATIANPNSTFWLAQDTGHLQAMATDPAEYEKQIQTFLTHSLHPADHNPV